MGTAQEMKNVRFYKWIPALLLAAILCLTGCYAEEHETVDFVAIVSGKVYKQEDYDAWYRDASHFEDVMDMDLMSLMGMDGSFEGEMPLLVFTRYLAIRDELGAEISEEDARQILASVEAEETEENLRCAVMYGTIQQCRQMKIEGIEADEAGAQAWYEQHLEEQRAYAQENPGRAWERYLNSAYPVTLYIPEGLRLYQAMEIGYNGASEEATFARSQEAWKKLMVGTDFASVFSQYNTAERYAENGKPKTLLAYPGWDEDPSLVLSVQNIEDVGQMCSPTKCEGGFVIARYLGEAKSGPVPYEDVAEYCLSAELNERQEKAWREALFHIEQHAQIRYASTKEQES